MARYPETQAAKKIIADLEERIAKLRVEAAEHHEAGAHAMGSTTMVYADAYQLILNGLPADLAYVEAQAVEYKFNRERGLLLNDLTEGVAA